MQSKLNPNDGWNAARYVCVSENGPVTLKVDQFKFDVDSDDELALMEDFVNS